MIKNITILFLIFISGVIYGQNLSLNDRINLLTNIERKDYNKKIQEWTVPIEFSSKEVKDYENRYNE